MFPVTPIEFTSGAVQMVIYFATAVAVFWSLLMTARA